MGLWTLRGPTDRIDTRLMTQTAEAVSELGEVRRDLELMLDCRLSAGFNDEEQDRYGRLLAREQLLLLRLGQLSRDA